MEGASATKIRGPPDGPPSDKCEGGPEDRGSKPLQAPPSLDWFR
jgi:hypothetical protein